MKIELTESLRMQRGQPPTVIETSILLFIIAHVWQETKELWRKGLVEYFKNMWNLIDFTRNCLHVGTAMMRVLAYIQAQSEIKSNPMAVYIPREAWSAFDPMLIADGLFAAGNVFAALKLVHIFSINPYLGPLQISLGRMVIDIIKFFFIYTLVLFAFACGLNQLLWYYADREKKQCFTGPGGTENWVQQRDSCLAWRRFSNLFESSQTLFWASFGLVDISNFELSGIKSYTRFWGLLMFGSYSVINVVVLLNLLIAMMSNSYQIISERADEEWKFARTRLFMNYFEEGGTVPPPFNLFPTAKNIKRLFCKKHSPQNMSIKRKETKIKERDTIYQSVMCNLVWRYVTAQQKACESDPVTEDDIKELRQDVTSFRHDLMHVLRCNGMNTQDINMDKIDVPPGKKIQIRKRRLIKDFSIGLMEVCTDDAAPEVPGSKSVLARLVGNHDAGNSQRWHDLIQLAKKSKMIGSGQSSMNISEDENKNYEKESANQTLTSLDPGKFDLLPNKEVGQDSNIYKASINKIQSPTTTKIHHEKQHPSNSQKAVVNDKKLQNAHSKASETILSPEPFLPTSRKITKKQPSPPIPTKLSTVGLDSNLPEKNMITIRAWKSEQKSQRKEEVPITIHNKSTVIVPKQPNTQNSNLIIPENIKNMQDSLEKDQNDTMINVPPSPKMENKLSLIEQDTKDRTLIDFSEKKTTSVTIEVDKANVSKQDKKPIFTSFDDEKNNKAQEEDIKGPSLITVSDLVTKAENSNQLQTILDAPTASGESQEKPYSQQTLKIPTHKICPKDMPQPHGWI